jgi:hypothetical protein
LIPRSDYSRSYEEALKLHLRRVWTTTEDLEYVKRVLSITAYSNFVKKILVDKGAGGIYEVSPPWLNNAVCCRRGGLKSTLLSALSVALPEDCVYTMDLSYAGLTGTILDPRESSEPTIPFAWQGNGKVKLVEEFDFDEREKKVIGALLRLSLGERYDRTIARKVKTPIHARGDDGTYWNVDNGTIELKTRGPFIFATMEYPEKMARVKRFDALLNRCLVSKYSIPQEQILALGAGKLDLAMPAFSREPREVSIPREDFDRIYEMWKFISAGDADARLLDNMFRLRAVCGKIEEDLIAAALSLNTPAYKRGDEEEEE